MTSLIDVIFLLLLFFMLSSTFSRFGEVELAAASGGASPEENSAPLFVQLESDGLTLNGEAQTLAALPDALSARDAPRVLVSLKSGVTAQRLTDLLVALRGVKGISVTVLEAI